MKNVFKQVLPEIEQVKRLLIFCIVILISCDDGKEEILVDTNELIGKWDAYKTIYPDGSSSMEGFQYSILMNYEHGFEVFKNGEYKSRYANGSTFEEGFHTDVNTGKWELKNDTLTFSHTFQGQTDSLHFLIIQVDNSELVIKLIGDGEWFDEAIHKTRYLKKATD